MTVSVQRERGVPLLASLRSKKRETAPYNVYIGENFIVSFRQWFRIMQLVEDSDAHGLALTEFVSLKHLTSMSLTNDSQKLLSVPNAGGSSVFSEVLSFEMLARCFGAQLLKTEMEVEYFPEGGSITDYTCTIRGLSLAVSVTRAMKYNGGHYTIEDATHLLKKKMAGVVQSSHNSLEDWSKQILHVWCANQYAAESLIIAYNHTIPTDLKSNTLVLLTIAHNTNEIFENIKTGCVK